MQSYSYTVEEEAGEYYYTFYTQHFIYTVYFKPDEYSTQIKEYPHLLSNGFAFGFIRTQVNKNIDYSDGIDLRIKNTIDKIVIDFYTLSDEDVVLLYHCDFSDDRQNQRSKCFTRWYDNSQTKDVLQRYEIPIVSSIASDDSCGSKVLTYYIGYLTPHSSPNVGSAHKEFENFAYSLAEETLNKGSE